jgi:hypothetical protein
MGLEERVRLGHFASYGERVICMTLSGSKLTAVLVNEPKSPSRCELVAEIANLARPRVNPFSPLRELLRHPRAKG